MKIHAQLRHVSKPRVQATIKNHNPIDRFHAHGVLVLSQQPRHTDGVIDGEECFGLVGVDGEGHAWPLRNIVSKEDEQLKGFRY